MASLPKGILRVLSWFDSTDDELKALVKDNGLLPSSIDELNVDLDVHNHAYDGNAWVKSPLPWGYTDRWAEDTGGTKSGAGTYTVATVTVPADYVYVATFAFIRNSSGARGNMSIRFKDGSVFYYGLFQTSPAQYIAYLWNGFVSMIEGDSMLFTQGSCVDGDVITAGVWGYKMKVNM